MGDRRYRVPNGKLTRDSSVIILSREGCFVNVNLGKTWRGWRVAEGGGGRGEGKEGKRKRRGREEWNEGGRKGTREGGRE